MRNYTADARRLFPELAGATGFADGIGTHHDHHAKAVIEAGLRKRAKEKKLKKIAKKNARKARGTSVIFTLRVSVNAPSPTPARRAPEPCACLTVSVKADVEKFEESRFALSYRRPRPAYETAARRARI